MPGEAAPHDDDHRADDDHPSVPKLLDVVEAVIEHHRQTDDHGGTTDDDRDPYDAAEHDLVDFCRKHHAALDGLFVDFSDGGERRFRVVADVLIVNDGTSDCDWFALDPPGDGQ